MFLVLERQKKSLDTECNYQEMIHLWVQDRTDIISSMVVMESFVQISFNFLTLKIFCCQEGGFDFSKLKITISFFDIREFQTWRRRSVPVWVCWTVLFAVNPVRVKEKMKLSQHPQCDSQTTAAVIKPLGCFFGGVTGSRRGGDGWKEAISSVNRTKDST